MGTDVSRLNALLDIDIWRVRGFRADVRIDFDEYGNILDATLLNQVREDISPPRPPGE